MTSMTTEFLIQWSHTVFDVAGAIFVKENENIIKYELEIWDAVVALSLWDAEGIELGEAHTNLLLISQRGGVKINGNIPILGFYHAFSEKTHPRRRQSTS